METRITLLTKNDIAMLYLQYGMHFTGIHQIKNLEILGVHLDLLLFLPFRTEYKKILYHLSFLLNPVSYEQKPCGIVDGE